MTLAPIIHPLLPLNFPQKEKKQNNNNNTPTSNAMETTTFSSSSFSSLNAYGVVLEGLSQIPTWHYVVGSVILILALLYKELDFHLIGDIFSAFRGSPILLTFHRSSPVYDAVVSRCKILNHARYLSTPWLSSPHLQIFFLNFFGRPPRFAYSRQIFRTSDGGTIALDWLLNSDVLGGSFHMHNAISKDNDTTPIVVVIPGLASDSDSAYIRHLAFSMAKHGWNVVVSNHRGLGGVSITSDCFYNAGWTEDTRAIIEYLHNDYPKAPLFAVGTSIGANILVKYLGEDGETTPVGGAAAICNPWDLLIGDRFICRRMVQKVYDRALTIGLQGYAKLHESRLSQLANWEGIEKSRSIRDFDNHATCHVGKFETVDTYYRRCSSSYYVGNVSVPLLCISALDDPVCTREAIPWDECRMNKNIVLATPQHGGHLAFFEGLSASGLWWVRAVKEFLGVLHSSPCVHVKKLEKQTSGLHSAAESSIDQGPYVNIGEDGMLTVIGSEQTKDDMVEGLKKSQKCSHEEHREVIRYMEQEEHLLGENSDFISRNAHTSKQAANIQDNLFPKVVTPIRRCLSKILQRNGMSIWLLALVAVVTSYPLVGSALRILFRKKRPNPIRN